MSFIGDMIGYNDRGDDLFGSNRNTSYNCVACGVNCMNHSPEQTIKCTQAIWGIKKPEEKT